MSEKEWEELPEYGYGLMQRQPISPAIPYNFRWRINEIKLMLSDLLELYKKYQVNTALILYETVKQEAEDLMLQLNQHILQIREKRKEWKDDKTPCVIEEDDKKLRVL